mgnify:FL=1
METKNIILVVIVVLVVALVGVAAYIYVSDSSHSNLANNTTTQNKTVIDADKVGNNTTVVGDNSARTNESAANNTTYKVYNPQSDSYVPVIGEKYDDEVNRWYTYDKDGVRYYNTRIN